MTIRSNIGIGAVALLSVALPAAAANAQAVAPKNNFTAAVNAMFILCPKLVKGGQVADVEALGLQAIAGPPDERRFGSRFKDGLLEVRFEPANSMCTVHYGGPGFVAVAGVARDLAAKNGFARLTGGLMDGAEGDVFTRPLDGNRRAQFIIVENHKSNTAAVAYSEKAGS